jgi:hypothetical protein
MSRKEMRGDGRDPVHGVVVVVKGFGPIVRIASQKEESQEKLVTSFPRPATDTDGRLVLRRRRGAAAPHRRQSSIQTRTRVVDLWSESFWGRFLSS